MSFADVIGSGQRRVTRRETLLKQMDAGVPWDRWVAQPYCYSQAIGGKARGVETMLRGYLLKAWFLLSNEGTEDGVMDSLTMLYAMRLNLIDEQVPDATTPLKSRHTFENTTSSRPCSASFSPS